MITNQIYTYLFFFELFKNQFIWWTIPLKTFISCIDVFALKIKFLNLLIFALEVCFKRYPTRKSISSISTNVSCTSFDDAKLKTFNSLFKFLLEDLFNSYKTIETAWERFNEGLFWEVGILKVLFARSNSLLVKPLSSLPNIIAKLFIFLQDSVHYPLRR